ncbi:hypothetical protein TIFTF001_024725 [Ficus carica]|uniref:C3H1-type domain-containing protein n=1 Tax=Ficus carica TaxID=3494 RepID=A0AA88ANT7_FICCA|nr:hypothetical protein TIFTF001_024725 [Ficus carica]
MAGHLYGFGATQSPAAAAAAGASSTALSSFYAAAAASRALTEPYFPSSLASSSDPSNYSAAAAATAMFLSQTDPYSRTASHLTSLASWPSTAVSVDDSVASGIKRSTEALYHTTVLGAPNTMGQTEAWYSTTALAKRFRYESASNLPIYPQRPGEKDCAHYMLTRTCKFGDSCKFDHPIWVPEGGIPDWKEVPPIASEALPERPGELDCPYFLKTQRCKFGLRCKFNHPKDKLVNEGALENDDVSALPERPSEAPCAFYLKTGTCKFGSTCKFHHPKDIQLPLGQDNGSNQHAAAQKDGTTGDLKALKAGVSFTPALFYNSKELPIRLGEPDCPFYLKTGSCKYGATCRYNHPDRTVSSLGHALVASPAAGLNIGVVNPIASLYQTIDPRFAQATVGVGPTVYPQRPGQIECDYYMKTGECKFGERCRFHHPIDRSTPTQSAGQEAIKLTLAGYPRREDTFKFCLLHPLRCPSSTIH